MDVKQEENEMAEAFQHLHIGTLLCSNRPNIDPLSQ
jgi:hypothetical protein